MLNARQEQDHGTSESTGRDWTRTDLFDGNGTKYSTFNEKQAAVILATPGKQLAISWDVKGKYNNLKSVAEHIEPKKAGGSRYDDPVVQHRITVLACMKVASETVNTHAADLLENFDPSKDPTGDPRVSVRERVKRIKLVAAELAVWVDEYAERAAVGDPFLGDDQHDDVPFAPELPAVDGG